MAIVIEPAGDNAFDDINAASKILTPEPDDEVWSADGVFCPRCGQRQIRPMPRYDDYNQCSRCGRLYWLTKRVETSNVTSCYRPRQRQ